MRSKEDIRNNSNVRVTHINLNDDMKDEAIIAFEFATKLFKELSTQIYDEDNRDTTNDPFKGTVIEGKD